MAGYTFDAGGLIALDRNNRHVLALIARAKEVQEPITVPATVLAQVARDLRRQVRISTLLRDPRTTVRPLDRVDATSVGRLLAASATADIVDAHVVVAAGRTRQQIVTSDPDDLRHLDPTVDLIIV